MGPRATGSLLIILFYIKSHFFEYAPFGPTFADMGFWRGGVIGVRGGAPKKKIRLPFARHIWGVWVRWKGILKQYAMGMATEG